MKKKSKLHVCGTASNGKAAGSKSDKMSKMLAAYVVILDPSLAHRELALRGELIKGFEVYGESRIELGRRLFNYREIFKPQRIWMSVTDLLGEAIGCESRKIRRMVEEYELSIGVIKIRKIRPVPEDAAEGDGESSLGEFQVSYLEARQLIRKAVAWCRNETERKNVLQQIISEEAYSTWNIDKPFILEIKPCKPLITLLADKAVLSDAA